jgi:hypothetical protein
MPEKKEKRLPFLVELKAPGSPLYPWATIFVGRKDL